MKNHIARVLQPAYAERHQTLLAAIRQHLVPLGVKIDIPSNTVAGGYFIWITLPSPLRAADVVQKAQLDESLRLAPGDLFRVPQAEADSGRFANAIRLCFAWAELPELSEGVRRLARVIEGLT